MTVAARTSRADGPELRKTSIGRRLIFWLVIFSSAITIATTAIQLYRDYLIDIDLIDGNLDLVESSFSEGIAQSLWLLDRSQLATQLEGILRIRDIVWVGIIDGGAVAHEVGTRPAAGTRSVTTSVPLSWTYNGERVPLGSLQVSASLAGVYDRLLDQVWVILVSNGIKTFAVTIFMYILFQRLVTRHLYWIARYVGQAGAHGGQERLQLRRPARARRAQDELDELVDAVNRMIDERDRSHAATISHRNRLRAILRVTPNAIIAVGPDLDIQGFNPAAERIFGWRRDDIIGRPLDLLVPEMPVGHRHLAADFMGRAPGEAHSMLSGRVVHGRHRDGREIPISVALALAETEEGRLAVAVVSDMTVLQSRQQEIEEKTRQIREQLGALKAAGEVKQRFIAALSHELRTPLNAIIGFSQMLLLASPKPVPEERKREYVQNIEDSGQHLLTLVEGLLEIAHLEGEGVSLIRTTIDVPAIVARVARIMAPQVARKRQDLAVSVPADLPAALGDETGLQQVLINLIANACKFSDKGGQILVAAGAEEDVLRISVADDGCGIPADQVERLGRPFVQVNDHLSGSAEGLGLGLAISRALVEEMGGTLSIESREGEWTRVSFTLPRQGATPDVIDLAAPV